MSAPVSQLPYQQALPRGALLHRLAPAWAARLFDILFFEQFRAPHTAANEHNYDRRILNSLTRNISRHTADCSHAWAGLNMPRLQECSPSMLMKSVKDAELFVMKAIISPLQVQCCRELERDSSLPLGANCIGNSLTDRTDFLIMIAVFAMVHDIVGRRMPVVNIRSATVNSRTGLASRCFYSSCGATAGLVRL